MICRLHQFVILVLAGLMASNGVRAMAVTRHCGELSQDEKTELMMNLTLGYNGLHWTFLSIPPFQQVARESFQGTDSFETYEAIESQITDPPEGRCPPEIKPGVKLCPVHYVQQTDKNRIPENIVQARCNCAHCLHDSSSLLFGKCEGVRLQTPVWRRTIGECKYKQDIEHVTVACTCKLQHLEIVNV